MAIRLSRKTVIIIAVVVALLAAGTIYAFVSGMFTPGEDSDKSNSTKPTTTGTHPAYAQQASFEQKRSEVVSLVTPGSKTGTEDTEATVTEEAIQTARDIINSEVTAADKSGNDAYINDSHLAKAEFLINIGRAQEALDDVLFPLAERYKDDKTYLDNINAYISWAYQELGNTAKAEEYFNKLPNDEGWD